MLPMIRLPMSVISMCVFRFVHHGGFRFLGPTDDYRRKLPVLERPGVQGAGRRKHFLLHIDVSVGSEAGAHTPHLSVGDERQQLKGRYVVSRPASGLRWKSVCCCSYRAELTRRSRSSGKSDNFELADGIWP